jgi:RNA polymerase sigma-70 factor (ECF subfamily)
MASEALAPPTGGVLFPGREGVLVKDREIGGLPLSPGTGELDRNILERHRRGDATAFEALVGAYSEPLFNLAFRLLGNREDALDLQQEVLLKAYRSLGRFRGDAALRTWLYRIAVNAAKNRARFWSRVKRGPAVSLDAADAGGRPAADRISDPRPGPEGEVYGHEIQARVQRGLDRLPLSQRLVVVLRDVEGMEYREIADALGISLGTVKSRLARGRETLRRDLTDLLG